MYRKKLFPYKPSEERLKLVRHLENKVAEWSMQYSLVEPNDKIMVCMSGGKDSYALLDMLLLMKDKVPFEFEIVAVNMDQKQPGFPADVLPNYLSSLGVDYRIVEKDTYSIVKSKIPEGKTMCSLCSRLRRGTLYAVAEELGATKIALGHHMDDTLETFFLNLFFAGKLEAMPPKFVSDDGKHIVIRPLIGIEESRLSEYAQLRNFPIIPCTLCGSQPNMQRKNIKKMIEEWTRLYPNRREVMLTALRNIKPSHLMDAQLYDFVHCTSEVSEVSDADVEI